MSIPVPVGGCSLCCQVHQTGQKVCIPYEVAAVALTRIIAVSIDGARKGEELLTDVEMHEKLLQILTALAETYHKLGIAEQAKHEGLTPVLNTYIGIPFGDVQHPDGRIPRTILEPKLN